MTGPMLVVLLIWRFTLWMTLLWTSQLRQTSKTILVEDRLVWRVSLWRLWTRSVLTKDNLDYITWLPSLRWRSRRRRRWWTSVRHNWHVTWGTLHVGVTWRLKQHVDTWYPPPAQTLPSTPPSTLPPSLQSSQDMDPCQDSPPLTPPPPTRPLPPCPATTPTCPSTASLPASLRWPAPDTPIILQEHILDIHLRPFPHLLFPAPDSINNIREAPIPSSSPATTTMTTSLGWWLSQESPDNNWSTLPALCALTKFPGSTTVSFLVSPARDSSREQFKIRRIMFVSVEPSVLSLSTPERNVQHAGNWF